MALLVLIYTWVGWSLVNSRQGNAQPMPPQCWPLPVLNPWPLTHELRMVPQCHYYNEWIPYYLWLCMLMLEVLVIGCPPQMVSQTMCFILETICHNAVTKCHHIYCGVCSVSAVAWLKALRVTVVSVLDVIGHMAVKVLRSFKLEVINLKCLHIIKCKHPMKEKVYTYTDYWSNSYVIFSIIEN